MPELVPEVQRRFARQIVERLRAAGFEAYWAGGCVRDQLLDRPPHDYDVATSAKPDEVRRLFGLRRTLVVGAAFGVVVVLGPSGAGQIEVATFRSESGYHDGRHPERVAFSSAREDALRRDFTINGLFYDPIEERVIDFVDGQADLRAGIVRAIGNPVDRFTEDKLRLLRAVRFAATLGFTLETATRQAVEQMASQVTVVSAERIADEMERMLVSKNRTVGLRLLLETGLAAEVLPEIVPVDARQRTQLENALGVVDRLERPTFSLALAVVLFGRVSPAGVERVCRRWRLSNQASDRAEWLVAHHGCLKNAPTGRWSVLQKILVSPGIEELLQWTAAEAAAKGREATDVAYCRECLAWPPEKLDPPPLATGDDLVRHGLVPGPIFSELLARLRDAQLDGLIETKAQAMAMVDRLVADGNVLGSDRA
ncbi:MAG: CCA tRNA nucleotidyltransferase [Pirellulales bacterium]|nr:CCA tRNA nucleotidyltransferase [Pirellulales bacterium]